MVLPAGIAGIFINIDGGKKEAMQAQKSAAFHRAFTKRFVRVLCKSGSEYF